MTVATQFRAMHAQGCFVIPNPWDIGSAVFLAKAGFRALATTSAGFAFSRGLPDKVDVLGRAEVLAHVKDIVHATPLPVSADYQNGYAHDRDELARSVAECVATGVAGLSIEDADGSGGLYDRAEAIERVRVARAVDADFVLTARCEAYLVGQPDAKLVIDRLVAFADAGADCLFAPGVRDPETIAAIVKAVAPKPVNHVVTTPRITVAQLADLGVRRISVGSALARVAYGAFIKSMRSIAETGSFDALADAAPFSIFNETFAR
jgi:2-methylisocitrate lyase-like PEP mutase family enzyme